MSAEDILSIKDLKISFGGIIALDKVGFRVRKNNITSLIGPNGAGKTTLFNCITGFYKANSGEIEFLSKTGKMAIHRVLGEKIYSQDFLNPVRLINKLYYKILGGVHLVVRGGMARTFQNIRLFKEMTVIENLLVAQHQGLNQNIISGIFQTKKYKEKEKEAVSKAYNILETMHLADEANKIASSLPYGKERMVEIARALCCNNPNLICLDEPAAGLNPTETERLSRMIQNLKEKMGITIFLIEHDMSMVMDISDYIVVLDHGKVIVQGSPDVVRNNPKVIEAYLGTDMAEINKNKFKTKKTK